VSRERLGALPPGSGPYIAVEDPLTALERIARWNRGRLGLEVVGITGSVGKTSTKEFLATILSGAFRVKSAPKSFNNRIGVAATLLSASPSTEVLVVELGTSGPGELSHLSRIVSPGRVILTEIGPSHLEGLRDLDGVIAAKAEVFEGLRPGGTAFIREGVAGFERFAAAASAGSVKTFGWDRGDFAVTDVRRVTLGRADPADYGYHFTLNGSENFLLPVPGKHNVLNAAAAVAVARDLGMRWDAIRSSLSICRLPPLRFQVVEEGGIVIVDDSYNSSPRSLEAAIDEWLDLGGHGVAVLGDMLEMGGASRSLHEAAGRRLAAANPRLIVTVGSESRRIAEAYSGLGGPSPTAHFDLWSGCVPFLESELRRGDRVLFKGSRRIRLDLAVKELRARLRARSNGANGNCGGEGPEPS
jgi:UDP-N-acetylmuramoyl-tripeptide--D-alanyl-D-alanine ligase